MVILGVVIQHLDVPAPRGIVLQYSSISLPPQSLNEISASFFQEVKKMRIESWNPFSLLSFPSSPNFHFGSIVLEGSRVRAYYYLLFEVYVVLFCGINHEDDNPFEGNLFLNRIMRLIIAACRGVEVTPSHITKKFPEIYFGIERILDTWDDGLEVLSQKITDISPHYLHGTTNTAFFPIVGSNGKIFDSGLNPDIPNIPRIVEKESKEASSIISGLTGFSVGASSNLGKFSSSWVHSVNKPGSQSTLTLKKTSSSSTPSTPPKSLPPTPQKIASVGNSLDLLQNSQTIDFTPTSNEQNNNIINSQNLNSINLINSTNNINTSQIISNINLTNTANNINNGNNINNIQNIKNSNSSFDIMGIDLSTYSTHSPTHSASSSTTSSINSSNSYSLTGSTLNKLDEMGSASNPNTNVASTLGLDISGLNLDILSGLSNSSLTSLHIPNTNSYNHNNNNNNASTSNLFDDLNFFSAPSTNKNKPIQDISSPPPQSQQNTANPAPAPLQTSHDLLDLL